MNKVYYLICVIFTSLTGCVSVPDISIEDKQGSIIVPTNESVCLVTPSDGLFEGKTYRNSGIKVAEKISSSIRDAYTIVRVEKIGAGHLNGCKNKDLRYVIYPEILEYEDRATGWSALPDKIRVKVNLVDTSTSNASTFTYYADSNLVASAFLEWGNAAPHELLGEAFEQQIKDLLSGK